MKKIINAVSGKELEYVIAKLLYAISKEKSIICHYSYLLKNTIDKMKELGVECDFLGNHSYRFHTPSDESVINAIENAYPNFNVGFSNEEIAYIVEKIRNAKDKPFVCHYSYLLNGTLNAIDKMGIKYDMIGQHGYRFYYPQKKTKEWYRLINYGRVKRNADGTFVKSKTE